MLHCHGAWARPSGARRSARVANPAHTSPRQAAAGDVGKVREWALPASAWYAVSRGGLAGTRTPTSQIGCHLGEHQEEREGTLRKVTLPCWDAAHQEVVPERSPDGERWDVTPEGRGQTRQQSEFLSYQKSREQTKLSTALGSDPRGKRRCLRVSVGPLSSQPTCVVTGNVGESHWQGGRGPR